MELRKTRLILGLLAVACAVWLGTLASAQSDRGCHPGPAPAQGTSREVHAYFDLLASRPDCMAAYSLRDDTQIQRYTKSKVMPRFVTYNPGGDPDPRRQDAAKVVLPAEQVSLRNTVLLPIGTADGTTTLVTWEAWFGSEFRFSNTGIGHYKTFQFASPARRIWFEVKTMFDAIEPAMGGRSPRASQPRRERTDGGGGRKNQKTGQKGTEKKQGDKEATPGKLETTAGSLPSGAKIGDHSDLAEVDVRAYGRPGVTLGPNVEKAGSLKPKAGSFTIHAETWTRYWVLIEQRANDWDLVSLWVADPNVGPVQIIDRRQLSVKGSVEMFWLEYNTSAQLRGSLGERVSYVRNVVMLRNVKDVASLLQRPAR